jgi:ABC-2 type transport system ATP-binding protein
MNDNKQIVETVNLTRKFGGDVAVAGVNLRVERGQIFGLIGSNGAGKTTTVRMLTTLLKPTSGTALVDGFDIVGQPGRVRACIGYVPQEAQADEALTGREHLILQGRLYGLAGASLTQRIDKVLDLVGLRDVADKRALEYSGGMRKLLDVASGLVHEPKLLFIDEPTSGVDITHRQKLIDYVKWLPDAGTTVFLTSHYLEEVDQLADRVAIIDNGRVLVEGAPVELKAGVGSSILDITLRQSDGTSLQQVAGLLREIGGLTKVVTTGNRLKSFGCFDDELLPKVRSSLEQLNVTVAALTIAQPTLDDVFFYHIGREIN